MLSRLRENSFMRNNAIFFVGSLTVSFLNYLYYPVLGRLLSVESFGELQVLVSLFAQFTVFITVLTLIATNIVVNEKNVKLANKTINELEKITSYIAFALLLLLIILSPRLKSTLQFESVWPFIIIGFVFVAGISLGFRTAYLRGKGDFAATSIEGILASTSKIIASAILVIVGFKTAGAIGGLLVAQFIALAYAGYKTKKIGFIKEKSARLPNWDLLKPQLKYSLLVLFVSFICTVQFTADILIIKYLFSPEVAGAYAGVATIARIIVYLAGSFAIVLLSSVEVNKPPEENSKLLLRSLLMAGTLSGIATLIFSFFPSQSLHLLFGSKYDGFAHLLPLLSVAMFMMTICNIIANYHIALRHYRAMMYVGGGALVGIIAVLTHHVSPDEVVQSITVGAGAMLTGLLCWTGYRAGFSLK